MGRSSKPTRLAVSPAVAQMDTIKTLVLQGHEVTVLPLLDEYDLILGDNCWNMNDDLECYLLTLTLPEARKRADARKKLST